MEPAAGDGRRPHAARGPLRACRAAVALHLRRQQLRPAHGPARHACARPRQHELGGGRHLRRQRRHVLCPAQGRAHRLRLLGLGDVRLRRLPRRVHEHGVGVRLGAALLAADHPGGRAAARPAGRHPHPPGRPLRALRWRDRHRPARRRRTLSREREARRPSGRRPRPRPDPPPPPPPGQARSTTSTCWRRTRARGAGRW